LENAISTSFGVVLRRLRSQRRMTQEKLGLEAGIQRKHVSAVELGIKQPTLTSVFKLSRALGLEPGALIALVDDELRASGQSY
jgi:transcriptional regulator with XRE-family HTH domain